MMKNEFEELLGGAVSTADYDIVEFVYTWHPSISETNGKQQIVDLYKNGGMLVIKGMVEAATYMKKLDEERRELEAKMSIIKERTASVNSGYLEFERCLADTRKYFDLAADMKEYEKFKSIFIDPKYSVRDIQEAEDTLGISVLK